MRKLERLRQKRGDIYRIAQRHNAHKVYVFGSCASQEETSGSDIDFLVEFNNATLFDHVRLEQELAEYLQSPVDVVSLLALGQDAFAATVKQEMVLL